MKKILLLSICLLSLQLSAQNIELTILQNSVKVQNDSLYFRYRIQNTSDTVLVFYNVRIMDVAVKFEDRILHSKIGLSAFIYDKENNLPTELRVSTRHNTYEHLIFRSFYNKYIILKQGESVEYDGRMRIIGNLGLIKGKYKFQLQYFSSDHCKPLYLKAKKKDNRLKKSLMFEGEARSNICVFEYK